MGLYDFTFYDLILRNAACYKERPAWFEADNGRALTFGQVRERVDRLATGLHHSGIVKGDRIAILGKNSLEYFLLYAAGAALGAILLPINWRLSADEVAFILRDGEPGAIFADLEYQDLIDDLKGSLTRVLRYYNLMDEEGNYADFYSLMEREDGFDSEKGATDDGFVIIHTAAVAGKPRGALLSHGNVLYATLQLAHFFNLTQEDVHLNLLPLFHVAGLFLSIAGFHAGALNVNMRKFDALGAVELIEEKKCSFMFDFSPILSSILEQHEKTGNDIRSLRAVAGLDTPKTIELYQEKTGGTFYCLYGQTETSCVATFSPYDDRPGSAGKPIPLARVRLVDDYDRPVPTGQVGEIAVKGPTVFKGYWNLPEDTAYTFREGWHHTGDLGRLDEDGFLWFAGRKAEKELIKPGGENVYPAEVEKVILQHPAVERTVVFGVPDPKWKEGIKAVCQLKEGYILKAQELMDFVGARIARYKRPQYVEFVSTLPLLDDGSPDRKKIKELYGADFV
jgi:long-chain acyl-CoA synthetase